DEGESLAHKRAAEIAKILADGGLGHVEFELRSALSHAAPDGVEDWKARRTTIRVEP
ncbi:MAG: hypothetical protein GWN29_07815, partial [Gammaproteobacteria bacterium]|nr:hypothetical protein [Gammaproteobacteria bacterium]